MADTGWMLDGACSNAPPDPFFPAVGHEKQAARVKREWCRDCPVVEPCLEYAIAERIDHGIWGDTTPLERRRIIKARAAAATARRVNA